jgi:hypothetical protein
MTGSTLLPPVVTLKMALLARPAVDGQHGGVELLVLISARFSQVPAGANRCSGYTENRRRGRDLTLARWSVQRIRVLSRIYTTMRG